jgi:hypothetical protein
MSNDIPVLARCGLLDVATSVEPSNADLLRAIATLTAKVDKLQALIAPRRSPLAINPGEIARTMALLRTVRTVSRETRS